jgi:hypothetical protein
MLSGLLIRSSHIDRILAAYSSQAVSCNAATITAMWMTG